MVIGLTLAVLPLGAFLLFEIAVGFDEYCCCGALDVPRTFSFSAKNSLGLVAAEWFGDLPRGGTSEPC